MKKIFQVLLVTSATIGIETTVAKAADVTLPEAEPVEYVRVCDAYGEGYFYIPGTDTCLKLGGFVYAQAKGGDDVYARSRKDRDMKTWRDEVRAHLLVATASETELGTLKTHIELRSDFDDGSDASSSELRFGYIDLGGLHIGVDESALNTFFDYYGNFINDDVVLGGAYRTNMIQYQHSFANGLTALVSIEQGGDEDTDFNGTIKDYTPDVIAGLKFEQGWGSITGAGAYDAVNEAWIGKAKVNLKITDAFNLWVMGAYKDLKDTYYDDIEDKDSIIRDGHRGIRAVDSFYGTWGGKWVGWLGASYKFTPKTTGNLQLTYEGVGNTYTAANVAYEMLPGLTVMPEVNYRKWNDVHSDLHDQDAIGGAIRIQRDF
ncbi:Porin subfamily protein [Bartonella apis]|uniref:porin n=1 Tax=Bartonella apis TaxID=1686310 RepID=UPI00096642E8|nr:porin [Bartonella apis]OLY46835.1 Porin subfamily protein [Bartonella apis]